MLVWALSLMPRGYRGLGGELEMDCGLDFPLQPGLGTEQEQVPGDKEDRALSPRHVQPPPTSSPDTPMTAAQLIPQHICAIQDNQVSMEQ